MNYKRPLTLITTSLALITASQGADTLSVEPAHPLPTFTKSLLWDSKSLPDSKDLWGAIHVADFNHDQRPDLAILEGPLTTPAGDLELGIYLQNTDGPFTKSITKALNNSITRLILSGDFNEDGHLDLIVDDTGNDLMILLGNGKGDFSDPKYVGFGAPVVPTVARVDGDSHLDLVAGSAIDGSVILFSGKGDGTFIQRTILPVSVAPNGAGRILVEDINRDGKPDIVVASPTEQGPNWTGNLEVFLGHGDGTFKDFISTPKVAAWNGVLGDFNGDGLWDYAAIRYSNSAEIWLGQGDGHFTKGRTYPLPNPPVLLAARDLNGDGILDLVLTGETNPAPGVYAAPLMILLGNGDGSFRSAQNFAVLPGALAVNNAIEIIDMNNDGLPDLVTEGQRPIASKTLGVAVALNQRPKPDPNLGFLVTVHSSTPGPRVLDASMDLIHWSPLATNAAPPVTWPFVDATKGQPQRFYRTRQP